MGFTIKLTINFELRQADRFAELGSDNIATGSFLQTADDPPHVHASKRIGERFPDKSYGLCLTVILSRLLISEA